MIQTHSPTSHERTAVLLGPNWFTVVMGTGIVAVAAHSLPVQVPGQEGFALAVWLLAAALLVVLVVATGLHWLHGTGPRTYLLHPLLGHFYGAVPMAMLTVGSGSLLLGHQVLGLRLATDLDWLLFGVGTVLGLVTAVLLPLTAFTQHHLDLRDAGGAWLMPVVPPMVSASSGALLVPTMPAGQGRETLLLACYAMFGLSLLASMVIITLVWLRLAGHEATPTNLVPTLFIVLGPLGQSITAAGLLGVAAGPVLAAADASAAQAFGLLYGVPTLGFASMWFVLAVTLTVRGLRRGMPFAMTWWSFTFPVGTCVTGVSELAVHTGLDVFRYVATGLFVLLVIAWAVVGVRTAAGVRTGALLHPAGHGRR